MIVASVLVELASLAVAEVAIDLDSAASLVHQIHPLCASYHCSSPEVYFLDAPCHQLAVFAADMVVVNRTLIRRYSEMVTDEVESQNTMEAVSVKGRSMATRRMNLLVLEDIQLEIRPLDKVLMADD